MRSIFSVLGLVLVLAIVGFLAKKQLSSVSEIKLPEVSGAAPVAVPVAIDPNASVKQQSQQIQQQVKQAVETATQQARPMPDDVK